MPEMKFKKTESLAGGGGGTAYRDRPSAESWCGVRTRTGRRELELDMPDEVTLEFEVEIEDGKTELEVEIKWPSSLGSSKLEVEIELPSSRGPTGFGT